MSKTMSKTTGSHISLLDGPAVQRTTNKKVYIGDIIKTIKKHIHITPHNTYNLNFSQS